MRTTAEIVKELEEVKKKSATLETEIYSLTSTILDLQTKLDAQKKTLRLTELEAARNEQGAAERELDSFKHWLDSTHHFIDVKEGEVRITTPYKRVWYFPTDNLNLYPFSQLVKSA